MDGREAMEFSGGSAPYYIHRGGGVRGSVPGTQSGGFQAPSGFIALSNSRDSSAGSAFSVEPPQRASFRHGVSIGSSPGPGGVTSSGETVKKKRLWCGFILCVVLLNMSVGF
ncbi:putative AT-hook motif nuclear-localized protein 5-like [Sesbania bispinosa]|nr:putative AT-hook motif nuclear-localized protein 5-like [Sesbania bispinosa]